MLKEPYTLHGDDTPETASLRCPGDSDQRSESEGLDVRQGQIMRESRQRLIDG